MLVFILKGYPRLSETFIAQEIAALEARGAEILIVALRRPDHEKTHPIHDRIRAPVHYLPEYLHREPGRVLTALVACWRNGSLRNLFRPWLHDFLRRPGPGIVRRLGQALVLANELPHLAPLSSITQLHAHFIHSPASVTRYASLLLGRHWSCSAHAKDIWTTNRGELARKLREASWTVTCTRQGLDYLRLLVPEGRLALVRHGLDFDTIPPVTAGKHHGGGQEMSILCVARLVAKKGHADLFAALALLPSAIKWRLTLIGDGELGGHLRRLADRLKIAGRIEWLGPCSRDEVFAAYGRADLFALACREGNKGDRDGLPNVLPEAMSQGVCCLATSYAAVGELITHGETGWLAAPADPASLGHGLVSLLGDEALRLRLGAAGRNHVRACFSMQPGIAFLHGLFVDGWRDADRFLRADETGLLTDSLRGSDHRTRLAGGAAPGRV